MFATHIPGNRKSCFQKISIVHPKGSTTNMVVYKKIEIKATEETELVADTGILPKSRTNSWKVLRGTVLKDLCATSSMEDIVSKTASRSNTGHLHEGAWGHMITESNSFPRGGQIGPVGEKPGANKHMSVTEASPVDNPMAPLATVSAVCCEQACEPEQLFNTDAWQSEVS